MFSCFKTKNKTHEGFGQGEYIIRSEREGLVLAISSSSGTMKQLVIEKECGHDEQKFQLIQKGPDYKIRCKKDKLYLTVDGPEDGERVYGTTKSLGDKQRFRIEESELGSGKYLIYTDFGKIITISDIKAGEGAMIFQEGKTAKQKELWSFETIQSGSRISLSPREE